MFRKTEKRQALRRKAMWGARLANLDGSRYLRCLALDISAGGARVDIESQTFPEEQAWFLDLRSRMAYEARVIWQKTPELGLQFVRGYRFDEMPVPQISRHIQGETRDS